MAGLRKGICIRKLDRPYTRKSKYKKKGYIRAIPPHKISRFEMGDKTKVYDYCVRLVSSGTLQIRHNALESARMVINRKLETGLGTNYFLRLCVYPHHAIRENKMLGGAHADRIQTGMAHSFGKVTGTAAQVFRGKDIFKAWVNSTDVEKAKIALKSANARLPAKCILVVEASKKALQ